MVVDITSIDPYFAVPLVALHIYINSRLSILNDSYSYPDLTLEWIVIYLQDHSSSH